MAKLLLVEDDNNLREIYEARLQAEGYTIVSAKDGEEALVVAKAEKPDLVISDVMMPKISGFEMLDILRNTEELKAVKVIMLTALGQTDDQKRADKLGADRYLVKSQVTLEDIVKVTHELLGDQTGGGSDGPAPSGDNPAGDGDNPAPAGDAVAPSADDSAAAPEPSPEPAAAAPAQATEVASEPASGPEPYAAPKPDAAATDKAAKSTVQEEADVEAKIEDFVAGATTEPTAPAPAAPAAPTADPAAGNADDQNAQDAAKSSPEASDDKLMADAVETLVASTDDKAAGKAATAAPASAGVTTIPVTTSPPTEQAPAPQPHAAGSDSSEDTTDEDESADSSGGVKKIIKPIDSPPKKDINQLLAEEEAKEAQSIPGATIAGAGSAEPEDKAAGEPMAPPSAAAEHVGPVTSVDSEPDPGSIAL